MPETAGGDAPLIGVDIGGTAVKLGAVSRAGDVLDERSLPIEGRGTEEVLDGVADAVLGILPRGPGAPARTARVGLGVPGLLDREAGRVLASPNLPFLDGVAVQGELARRLELPREAVVLENDANAAALGELWLGGARGERDFVLLTLGTGVGGGIVLGGELFLGAGMAGELGHVVIDPEGPVCGCGARGCLETLASASATRRRALALGLPAEAPGDLVRLAAAARSAEGPERDLLHAVGRDLGHALGLVVSLLDVRTFVFGGGFSAALDTLEAGIERGVSEWAYRHTVRAVKILRATLGPSAGWIGAARLTL